MVEKKTTAPAPEGGERHFLSRWSRRKDEARQGIALTEPLAPVTPVVARATVPAAPDDAPDPTEPQRPLPTLADVHALSSESDFSRFMAKGVGSEVRNAAMKKLFFSDPHYNVMDGLDIYIDDYSKTIPLTAAVLKTMSSARFLGLCDDEEPQVGSGQAGVVTTDAASGEVAPTPDHIQVAGDEPAQHDASTLTDQAAQTGSIGPGRGAVLVNTNDPSKNPDL